jgi:hypothetical protein
VRVIYVGQDRLDDTVKVCDVSARVSLCCGARKAGKGNLSAQTIMTGHRPTVEERTGVGVGCIMQN